MGSLGPRCAMAFAAVFLLLTVLCILMTVLTAVLPARESASSPLGADGVDTALLAAITATMNQIHPGARVSKIEERK